MGTDEKIAKAKENFKDHEIQEMEMAPTIKKFRFVNPKDSCYWFELILADNLILMTGDCYTFIAEPGRGRDGLAFLRGSVKSVGYFLEKCPFQQELSEYNKERAQENFKDEMENESITAEQYEEILELFPDQGPVYDEGKYYEICYEHGIDEPSSPRSLKSRTILQLAGLQAFIEKYDLKKSI
jgi:hypothetical protein